MARAHKPAVGYSDRRGKPDVGGRLTQSEFARQAGVTKAAVSRAITRGALTLGADGRLTLEEGLREWRAKSRLTIQTPGPASVAKARRGRPPKASAPEVEELEELDEELEELDEAVDDPAGAAGHEARGIIAEAVLGALVSAGGLLGIPQLVNGSTAGKVRDLVVGSLEGEDRVRFACEDHFAGSAYNAERTKKLRAERRKAELVAAELHGELIRVGEVAQTIEEVLAVVRASLLAWPDGLADLVVGLRDARRAREFLHAEVRRVLGDMERALAEAAAAAAEAGA